MVQKLLSAGQLVVYGIHGVCKIVGTDVKTVDRKKVEYYVVEPLSQAGACFFVPSGNPVAVAKLRPILTKQELDALFSDLGNWQDVWVAEENQRKQYYRELISGGDRKSLLSMILALQAHRITQQDAGRKFHLCDENFLRDAQRLLCMEIAVILETDEPGALAYLREHIKAN